MSSITGNPAFHGARDALPEAANMTDFVANVNEIIAPSLPATGCNGDSFASSGTSPPTPRALSDPFAPDDVRYVGSIKNAMLDHRIAFSLRGKYGSRVTDASGTVRQFVRTLSFPRFAEKGDYGFFPGTVYGGKLKKLKKTTVRTISALVYDFDYGVAPAQVEAKVAELGLFGIIYASHTHSAGNPKFRLVLPFSTPWQAWHNASNEGNPTGDAEAFWKHTIYNGFGNEHFPGFDPNCAPISMAYNFRTRARYGGAYFLTVIAGEFLDWRTLPVREAPPKAPRVAGSADAFTLESLHSGARGGMYEALREALWDAIHDEGSHRAGYSFALSALQRPGASVETVAAFIEDMIEAADIDGGRHRKLMAKVEPWVASAAAFIAANPRAENAPPIATRGMVEVPPARRAAWVHRAPARLWRKS